MSLFLSQLYHETKNLYRLQLIAGEDALQTPVNWIYVAEALYCHRNTINKRVSLLKDQLGYRLKDPSARFELWIAFCIRDYLDMHLNL